MPRHRRRLKQLLLKQLSKNERRHEPRTAGARPRRREFPAVMEFTQASYEGEPCVQVVFRKQESAHDPELAQKLKELQERDPVAGLLNRQTFLRTCSRTRFPTPRRNQARHACCWSSPTITNACCTTWAWTRPTRCSRRWPGSSSPRWQRRGRGALRRNTASRVLLNGGDHLSAGAGERIRAAFADGIFEIGDSSAITASIGGVQIGEKQRQRLAGAGQGQPGRAVGAGRGRQPLRDLRPPAPPTAPREERGQAWVRACAMRWTRTSSSALPPGDFPAGRNPNRCNEAYLAAGRRRRRMVGPSTFPPIAEEHGLLAEIDRWWSGTRSRVLGERLEVGQTGDRRADADQPGLARRRARFARHIGETLLERGVPGDRLVLQLPSPVFTHMRDVQCDRKPAPRWACAPAKQFGAGIDSMQLLAHVTPAFLKLDRSFMEDLPKNAENQKRIQAIASHARGKGMRSIAEFVQDAASMSTLFSCGVDCVEGDFLALPSARR